MASWSKNEKDPIQGPLFSISIDFAFIAFVGLQNVRNNGRLVYKPVWLHSTLEMQSQRMNWSTTHATKCSRWLIKCWRDFQTWDDTGGVVQNSAMRRVLLILEMQIWSFEKFGGSIWYSNTNINRQSSWTINGDSLFPARREQKGRRIKNSQELLDSESRV